MEQQEREYEARSRYRPYPSLDTASSIPPFDMRCAVRRART